MGVGLPSAARRTKAERSEAHGAFTLAGLGQGWGAALVGGNFCPGSHLPRGGTVVLWVDPDAIFGATELPHPAFTLCPKTHFWHLGGPPKNPQNGPNFSRRPLLEVPNSPKTCFFGLPTPKIGGGGGGRAFGRCQVWVQGRDTQVKLCHIWHIHTYIYGITDVRGRGWVPMYPLYTQCLWAPPLPILGSGSPKKRVLGVFGTSRRGW